MEVLVTTGAISHAKLQPTHHHQQTDAQFLQTGCTSCRPTNSVKALKGKALCSIQILEEKNLVYVTCRAHTSSETWCFAGLPVVDRVVTKDQSRSRSSPDHSYMLWVKLFVDTSATWHNKNTDNRQNYCDALLGKQRQENTWMKV